MRLPSGAVADLDTDETETDTYAHTRQRSTSYTNDIISWIYMRLFETR